MSSDFFNKGLQWFKTAVVVVVCPNVQGDEDESARSEGFWIGGVTNQRPILTHELLKSGFQYWKVSRDQVFHQLRLRIKCGDRESLRGCGRAIDDPQMRETGETDGACVVHAQSVISSCNFDWIQTSFWIFVWGD